MIRKFIFSLLLLTPFFAFAQQDLSLNEEGLIAPNYNNLQTLLEYPLEDWKKEVSAQGYQFMGVQNNIYMYQKGAFPTRYHVIAKDVTNDQIAFIWNDPNSKTKTLTDFRTELPSESVNLEDGTNVYFPTINEDRYRLAVSGDNNVVNETLWFGHASSFE